MVSVGISKFYFLLEAVPDVNSFPLLEASISSTKMFVSSPLSFIENQCHDLLLSIANLTTVPTPDNNLQKVTTKKQLSVLNIDLYVIQFVPRTFFVSLPVAL